MTPIVSIITPVYNREKYIKETIENVQKQTFKDFEFIIIDDGSTDSTKEILQEYASKDSRIKLIFLEENNSGRIGKVRNIGLKAAVRKYVAFIDSDDLWVENKLELQIQQLEKSGSDIVYHPIYRFEDDITNVTAVYGKVLRKGYIFPELFEKGGNIPITSVLMLRSIFDKAGYFDEEMKFGEDHDLTLRISFNDFKFDYISEALGFYRRGHESVMNDKSKLDKNSNEALSIKVNISYRKKLLESNKMVALKLSKENIFYGYIYLYFNLIANSTISKQEKDEITTALYSEVKKYKLFTFLANEIRTLFQIRNPQ